MNKLTKQQRERLIGVIVGTFGVMAALWYMVAVPMQDELATMIRNTAAKRDQASSADGVVRRASEIGTAYTNQLAILQQREAGLAPDRDTYAWIINTVNPFIQNRTNVNIYSYSQPDFTDQGLFPKFPYRWATFHIKGVGYYQDFGKFFADFENSFPYFRIQNLDVTANPGPGFEAEKLSFTFDIVTPVVSSSDSNK